MAPLELADSARALPWKDVGIKMTLRLTRMRAVVSFGTLLFACSACSDRHVVVYVATDRENRGTRAAGVEAFRRYPSGCRVRRRGKQDERPR